MRTARRRFLAAAATCGFAGFGRAVSPAEAEADKKEYNKGAREEKPGGEGAEGISAAEDLMREHGVLRRILLVYEEGLRRLAREKEITAEVFHQSATLVRKFVEDYHEKLEESFVFPLFEKRRQLIPLVKTLGEQHQAGRLLTDAVLRDATAEQFPKAEVRKELVRVCRAFIRMYRPHSAREDTVLFPALHKIMTGEEMEKLGDQFEEEEDRRFGEGGFERTVDQLAALEKQLGILDLDQFTPSEVEK
jgi:hemerythrin-like domain-containing protein